jgi:selenocysteine lyase/cysteine desulfurase
MEKVNQFPKVKIHTSLDPKWGGAIGIVSVQGKKSGDLDNYLFSQYKIHTTTIEWENIRGVRITPNVYTTLKNLDTLVQGIREFAEKA